jgi:predicted Kef-type K+ transport protein
MSAKYASVTLSTLLWLLSISLSISACVIVMLFCCKTSCLSPLRERFWMTVLTIWSNWLLARSCVKVKPFCAAILFRVILIISSLGLMPSVCIFSFCNSMSISCSITYDKITKFELILKGLASSDSTLAKRLKKEIPNYLTDLNN